MICRERKRKTIAWCSLGDKDVPNHLCFGEGGFFQTGYHCYLGPENSVTGQEGRSCHMPWGILAGFLASVLKCCSPRAMSVDHLHCFNLFHFRTICYTAKDDRHTWECVHGGSFLPASIRALGSSYSFSVRPMGWIRHSTALADFNNLSRRQIPTLNEQTGARWAQTTGPLPPVQEAASFLTAAVGNYHEVSDCKTVALLQFWILRPISLC